MLIISICLYVVYTNQHNQLVQCPTIYNNTKHCLCFDIGATAAAAAAAAAVILHNATNKASEI